MKRIVVFCMRHSSFFLLSVAFCNSARGQYSIDWDTIDGGGGTSTGGVYTVTGTIGQPDAVSELPYCAAPFSENFCLRLVSCTVHYTFMHHVASVYLGPTGNRAQNDPLAFPAEAIASGRALGTSSRRLVTTSDPTGSPTGAPGGRIDMSGTSVPLAY